MPRKILFCASTLSHLNNFHQPYIQAFQERGFEVWAATNACGEIPGVSHTVALPMQKKLWSPRNVQAIFAVRKLLLEQHFDALSTHTTLAGLIARAAVRLLPKKKRPRVFHTSHGYLFHKKGGLKKWIYLLPEKMCARVTNVLMVMNREDFEIADRHKLFRQILRKTGGMGLKFSDIRRAGTKENPKGFRFIYAAEFSKRKNQSFLIRAFAKVSPQMPDARLVLAGTGEFLEECKALAVQLGMKKKILFPGHLKNMKQAYASYDVCVSTSRIEGLPFHVMEAMVCGLPVVASDVKGHHDLLEEGTGGILYPEGEPAALEDALLKAYHGEVPHIENPVTDLYPYSLNRCKELIMEVYDELLH